MVVQRATVAAASIVASLIALILCGPAACQERPASPQQGRTRFSSVPLYFEPNQGQDNRKSDFILRAPGYTVLLSQGAATLTAGVGDSKSIVRLNFVGSNPHPKPVPLRRSGGRSNYFVGNDPENWRLNLPHYESVRYEDVYPGIDLVYYESQGRLEYDLIVAPRGDPNKIRLAFERGRVELADEGDLLVRTDEGAVQVRQKRPFIYQGVGPLRHIVDGSYRLDEMGGVSIELGAYDKRKPLVIDPVLIYSTRLGGSDEDEAHDVAVDLAGNVYITGSTKSRDFPTTPQALDKRFNTIFVAKLNANGTELVYSTYLGGRGGIGHAIATDSLGNAYVTGEAGDGLPTTPDAFQKELEGNNDAFVTKLDASGTLVYSTYLGGKGWDAGRAIAVDSTGSAYVTGSANLGSRGFPTTPGAFRASGERFVAKLNAEGTLLAYSTMLGEVGSDYGIAVDSEGLAYVTGETAAPDFPAVNAIQSTFGGGMADAFLTKLNETGSELVYSTYLGGDDEDKGSGVAVDTEGNAYVTGFTKSSDFPTNRPLQVDPDDPGCKGISCDDAFVAKVNAAGSNLVYSTYLGGRRDEVGRAIAVDNFGNAYVTGRTASPNFPIVEAIQPTYSGLSDCCDVFVSMLAPDGGSLLMSSFLGLGDGTGVTVDQHGNAYVAGKGGLASTPGAFQSEVAGRFDAFVVKIDFADGPRMFSGGVVNAASFRPSAIAPGEIVTIFGTNLGPDTLVGLRLDGSGLVSKALVGTKVLFDGVPAPLVFVREDQVSAIVPYAVFGKSTTFVEVEYQGERSTPVELDVGKSAPGIFTVKSSGRGQGAVLNQDSSLNSPSNPAKRGTIVALYGTGEGQTSPPGVDGLVAGDVLPKPLLPLSVFIGGFPSDIRYAGAAPGLVAGVVQVNAKVPALAPSGSDVPIVLTIGDERSQPGVTIAVE